MGLRAGLCVLHLDDVRTAAGPAREALVNARNLLLGIVAAALIALPFVYRQPYHVHGMVLILIWSFAYTSRSVRGRFGPVSLGHGGLMGVGAHVTAPLRNQPAGPPRSGSRPALLAAGG